MQVAVLADEGLKKELLQKSISDTVTIEWHRELGSFVKTNADVYIDLVFQNDASYINSLKSLLPKPVVINAVTETLSEIGQPFIRINAWPGFLNRNVIEIAIGNNTVDVASLFNSLGWSYKIVRDEVGMITPRVISMIVNEAYFALGEEVSTKEEIDTAMKLGTNYPWGPFEWSEKIGLEKIKGLLLKLSSSDERYSIAPAMLDTKKNTPPAMEGHLDIIF